MKLALFQFAPALGAVDANLDHIAAAAHDARADLLITPELAVTGYDVRDDAWRLARTLSPGSDAPGPLAGAPGAILAGMIERGDDGIPYNVAALFRNRLEHVHRKMYLPTYGMFDEARWFGRGRTVRAFDLPAGWRAGALVCEDFWHPGLAYVLAAAGIDLLLVMAAAPGRDVRADGPRFASTDAWRRIAQTTAMLYGIYVVLANRTGVEGGVTFAGRSLICAPDGSVISEAGDDEEVTLVADLTRDAVHAARRPGAHLRDEDPLLVARELLRLAESP